MTIQKKSERIIVHFAKGTTKATVDKIIALSGCTLDTWMARRGVAVVILPEVCAEKHIEAFEKCSEVVSATLDFKFSAETASA